MNLKRLHADKATIRLDCIPNASKIVIESKVNRSMAAERGSTCGDPCRACRPLGAAGSDGALGGAAGKASHPVRAGVPEAFNQALDALTERIGRLGPAVHALWQRKPVMADPLAAGEPAVVAVSIASIGRAATALVSAAPFRDRVETGSDVFLTLTRWKER